MKWYMGISVYLINYLLIIGSILFDLHLVAVKMKNLLLATSCDIKKTTIMFALNNIFNEMVNFIHEKKKNI